MNWFGLVGIKLAGSPWIDAREMQLWRTRFPSHLTAAILSLRFSSLGITFIFSHCGRSVGCYTKQAK